VRSRSDAKEDGVDGRWSGIDRERQGVANDTDRIPLGELREATLIERPNRYLGIVDLDGEAVQAHIPDPGRLSELLYPGARVYVRKADMEGKTRKTRFDLLLVAYQGSGTLVSIYTTLPNRLMRAALEARAMPEFAEHDTVRHEYRHGSSRFDFHLSGGSDRRPCFIEVKSVSLMRDGVGWFPDAPTVRGTRHVRELTELHREGNRAAVVFVAQRSDIASIRPEAVTDPDFATATAAAQAEGVEFYAWNSDVSVRGVRLAERIPVEIPPL